MKSLRVQARLRGAIATPQRAQVGVMLDALLGKMLCVRDHVPPALAPEDLVDLDIPLAKSECGRFYLTSMGLYRAEQYGCEFIHKPPVISEAKTLGSREAITSINVTAGPNKGYRIPIETAQLEGDTVTWYCVGDADRIAELLALVPALGRKRGIGFGALSHRAPFAIEEMGETWEGFPCVRDRRALRPLPAEYPWLALAAGDTGYACISPPYWMHEREQLCLLPELER